MLVVELSGIVGSIPTLVVQVSVAIRVRCRAAVSNSQEQVVRGRS